MSRLLAVFVALCLAACSDPRATSLSRLRGSDAAALRTEAAKLAAALLATSGSGFVPVRPEQWPAPLLKLRPLRMNLYRDGLAVSLASTPGWEYGLHIVPSGASGEPHSSDRTHYEKLQEGIWYFAQKR